MRFMLLIIDDEQEVRDASPDAIESILDRHATFSDELHRAGAWVASYRLRLSPEAATVRRREGRPVVVDGPFVESKELLGGLYLIEAASRDEAVEWATRMPTLSRSAVEVRQVWGSTETRRWREG